MFFQNNILDKYIAALPHDEVAEAWGKYKNYFQRLARQWCYGISTHHNDRRYESYQKSIGGLPRP